MPSSGLITTTPLHPRPTFQRAHWKSLDGAWKFTFDDVGLAHVPADIVQWPLMIQVPFAPESIKSGIRDTGYHTHCWYEREFEVGELPRGQRVLIHFGAVDYQACVWINGHYVGDHRGGHTPFSFDITPFIREGSTQVVSVHAEDDPHDLTKPRGKQDWQLEPHSIWYPRTSGIWQTVWIEFVPETYLDRVRWDPHLERWEIGCELFVAGPFQKGMKIKVRLSCGDQLLACDTYEVIHAEVHRRIALSDPGIDDFRNELLWSPEKPTLIQAELELLREDGHVIDRVNSYTALRSVDVLRDRFMLNGRPYFLRLVLDQGYWPESLMTAPDPDAFRRDIELVKQMGFNGVRKHQKIEDPLFLYWADVLGLLVWEEMPSTYRFTHESVERMTREWMEVIDRDSNHPCIAVWVPFNESWGVPDLPQKLTHQSCVQALYHLTKALDETRPVIGNDGWESSTTDIIGIHDYDNVPRRLIERYGPQVKLEELLGRRRPGGRILTLEGHPHRGQPVMLTEFGGIAYVREDDPDKLKSWGYAVSTDPNDFQRRYASLLSAVNKIELFSGFCYTQLTDTFQEMNGLLYADRTPKIPLELIARATRGSAFEREEHHLASEGELRPYVPQPQLELRP